MLTKQRQAEEKRLARRREKLEHDIESTEQKIEDIQQEMCRPAVLAEPARLNRLDAELKEEKAALDELYEEYMEL